LLGSDSCPYLVLIYQHPTDRHVTFYLLITKNNNYKINFI